MGLNKMKLKLSLQTKAVIVISILVILVSAVLTVFFIRQEEEIIRAQFKERGTALAGNLAYNCEYGILTGNKAALENLVEGVVNQPDVVYCRVKDAEGEMLAGKGVKGRVINISLLDKAEMKTLETPPVRDEYRIHHFTFAGNDYYDISFPVKSVVELGMAPGEEGLFPAEEKPGTRETRTIGTINVGLSLESANILMKKRQQMVLRIVAIIILLTSIIIALATKFALIPVQMLVNATRRISSGDLDFKVGIRSGDELGALADSFNKMAADLKKSTVSIEVLEAAQKRFEDISISAGDWIWEVDKEGKYTYSSPVVEKVLGYKPKEVFGKYFYDFFLPEDREENKKRAFEAFAKKETFRDFENRNVRKDGRVVILETTGIPILGGDGTLLGYRGIDRDITDRKKVEVSQRLATLGEMVSDMAHEVNNPLQIVSGRAQLLLMDTEDKNKEAAEALQIIQDQCARAKDIIQRMLQFSKPSKGVSEPHDIHKTIDFVVGLLEHQFSLIQIEIRKNYNVSPSLVKIDEKQIHEVIMNLLKNASEAMPNGGTIIISTAREGADLSINITDTGTGISEENIKKIFDPFFTTKEMGTGLGLSVCYGIIAAHSGELKFESKAGKGTTATILLPLAA